MDSEPGQEWANVSLMASWQLQAISTVQIVLTSQAAGCSRGWVCTIGGQCLVSIADTAGWAKTHYHTDKLALPMDLSVTRSVKCSSQPHHEPRSVGKPCQTAKAAVSAVTAGQGKSWVWRSAASL